LGACRRIFETTDGIPRLINSLCDCAMLSGYVKDRKRIDSRMVGECLIDMRIAIGLRPKTPDRPEDLRGGT
jgi:general secretion pathway protein A